MKRFSLLLVLLVNVFETLLAGGDLLRWGITAGANISKVQGDGPGFMNTGWQFDSRGGYYMGLTARLSIPIINIGLDGSFVYSQETADLHSNGVVMEDRLRYFSLPVHLRYDFEIPAVCEVLIPYIYAGPQCNMKLNDFDWYDIIRHDNDSQEQLGTEHENDTNPRSWKFDLGFGIIVVSHIQIAYNYAFPLNNAFGFDTTLQEGRNNFKLGTHRIGVSYYF